jgi:hypothetical protein
METLQVHSNTVAALYLYHPRELTEKHAISYLCLTCLPEINITDVRPQQEKMGLIAGAKTAKSDVCYCSAAKYLCVDMTVIACRRVLITPNTECLYRELQPVRRYSSSINHSRCGERVKMAS